MENAKSLIDTVAFCGVVVVVVVVVVGVVVVVVGVVVVVVVGEVVEEVVVVVVVDVCEVVVNVVVGVVAAEVQETATKLKTIRTTNGNKNSAFFISSTFKFFTPKAGYFTRSSAARQLMFLKNAAI